MYFKMGSVPFVLKDTDDLAFVESLTEFCLAKEDEIMKLPSSWKTEQSSPTSARYGNYNFFLFEHPLVENVLGIIRDGYSELIEESETECEALSIQSWINLHRRGERLNIHRHLGFWGHGYLAVNAEGTSTIFEIGEEDLELKNKNGRLTIIGSDDVWHRVTPYSGDDVRVSIAFDLIRNSDLDQVKNRVFVPFT